MRGLCKEPGLHRTQPAQSSAHGWCRAAAASSRRCCPRGPPLQVACERLSQMGRQGGPSPAGANSETLLELLASFFALYEGGCPARLAWGVPHRRQACLEPSPSSTPEAPPRRRQAVLRRLCAHSARGRGSPCHWAAVPRGRSSADLSSHLALACPSPRVQACCAAAGPCRRGQTPPRCAGAVTCRSAACFAGLAVCPQAGVPQRLLPLPRRHMHMCVVQGPPLAAARHGRDTGAAPAALACCSVLRRVRVDTWAGRLRCQRWEREGYCCSVEDPFDRWAGPSPGSTFPSSPGCWHVVHTAHGPGPAAREPLRLPNRSSRPTAPRRAIPPLPCPLRAAPPFSGGSTDNCARTVRTEERLGAIAAAAAAGRELLLELSTVGGCWVVGAVEYADLSLLCCHQC